MSIANGGVMEDKRVTTHDDPPIKKIIGPGGIDLDVLDIERKNDGLRSLDRKQLLELKAIIRELKLLGIKFIIRLTVRTHEIIVEEILGDPNLKQRFLKIKEEFLNRGLDREDNPLVVNFCLGFNDLKDLSSAINSAIEERSHTKSLNSGSIRNALKDLEKAGVIEHIKKDELRGSLREMIRRYVDRLVQNIGDEKKRMQQRIDLENKISRAFSAAKLFRRSIIRIKDPDTFDSIYSKFLENMRLLFEISYLNKDIHRYIKKKLDELEKVIEEIKQIERELKSIEISAVT